jgi:hypothetical protein
MVGPAGLEPATPCLEAINTHDKLIIELQERSKLMAESITRGADKLTEYFNQQR